MFKIEPAPKIVFVAPSAVGLWLFLFLAMYMEWIEPTRRGVGDSGLIVVFLTLFVIVASIPFYSLFLKFFEKIKKSQELSYWIVFAGGFIHGFIVTPIFILMFVGPSHLFIGWSGLIYGPVYALMFLTMSMIISVSFSAMVVFLIGKLKGKYQNPLNIV